MGNGHGGFRQGAGRKPKALRYESQISAIEEKIVGMLPRLTDKLFEMAMEGDIRATRYLMDRVLGRVAALESAPSVDRSIPYTEREFSRDTLERNLDLCDDELRLERRAEDMFEYVGDDDGETDNDLIPMSLPETDDLLRKARVEQGQDEPADRDAEQKPHPNPLPDPEREKDAGQLVAPGRSAPFPNNRIEGCGFVPNGHARGNDSVDTPESTASAFIPSDGPNDPDRTWYYPE